jgi:hypothetical protein
VGIAFRHTPCEDSRVSVEPRPRYQRGLFILSVSNNLGNLLLYVMNSESDIQQKSD